MDDRELLELAARAIGLYVKHEIHNADDNFIGFRVKPHRQAGRESAFNWNPLTDDGDALRLAVELHIDIRHFMYERGHMDCLVDRLGRGFSEKFTDDPRAATRRAIVRAAAEIGKFIQPERGA